MGKRKRRARQGYREKAGDPTVDRLDDALQRIEHLEFLTRGVLRGDVKSVPVSNLEVHTKFMGWAAVAILVSIVVSGILLIHTLEGLHAELSTEIKTNQNSIVDIQRQLEEVR